ncbi:nitrous oxide reductase family maturation protein NosD [Microbulbifer yueqingensis]|uniref:Nitrous oxidase accessory protein n=1 Tax=Microbulbifer yueqingensis TaxID=658219 RepID=A0A1G9ELC4_9GAMM|nr:nitrous oxide reductase family maturation protein NosD [Microbulbifer yueqingensis]SDK76982.1 nitrous oxidase accessory protein [Microbulbifer yueqingensis]
MKNWITGPGGCRFWALGWLCGWSLMASAGVQPQLDALSPGEQLLLPGGELPPIRIEVANVTIQCSNNTVIDGGGRGHAVVITAPDVTLRGCMVRNWGADLNQLDAGIFVARSASGAAIEDNTLTGPGFGIWLDAARNVRVRNNRVRGDATLRSQDRGNGIHLFNTQGALIEGNRIQQTRDAIYIETANHNRIIGNVMSDLRYGIHYMYSHSNHLEGNITRNTRTGYALMQSKRLTVIDNHSEGDRNYGILMNFITQSEIRGNVITGVRQGQSAGVDIQGAEGKAVFIYNSLYNTFSGNVFRDSDIGIHLTAGSEDNQVFGNGFIDNRRQVKYVATRPQEWSDAGRGNFWSDYLGWDRDQDGVGDVAYEPNDQVDRLLWTYPQARVLMNSPAVDTLRWVQRAFPVVKPAGVADKHPLMRLPAALQEK